MCECSGHFAVHILSMLFVLNTDVGRRIVVVTRSTGKYMANIYQKCRKDHTHTLKYASNTGTKSVFGWWWWWLLLLLNLCISCLVCSHRSSLVRCGFIFYNIVTFHRCFVFHTNMFCLLRVENTISSSVI